MAIFIGISEHFVSPEEERASYEFNFEVASPTTLVGNLCVSKCIHVTLFITTHMCIVYHFI